MLGPQPGQPVQLVGPEPAAFGLPGKAGVPLRVPGPEPVLGAGAGQLLPPVPADRAQQPVPVLGAYQDRLADQPVQDGGELPRSGAAHVLGGGQVEGAAEHRQLRPGPLFGTGAQLVAPVQGTAQGTLPGRGGTRTGGQQVEPVVEALPDLLGRQRPQPYRRQLDGQRQPVQPPADPGDRGLVVGGEREPGYGGGGPLAEQGDRRVGAQSAVLPPGRYPQRLHAHHTLVGQSQGFPAGRQDPQRSDLAQQRAGQLGARLDQVLAVVQHQHGGSVGEELDQPGHRRRPRLVVLVDGLEHRRGYQLGVLQLVQLDPPDAAGRQPDQLVGRVPREPGLAHPRDPGQGDQPVPRDQALDVRQLAPAADEARPFRRQSPDTP